MEASVGWIVALTSPAVKPSLICTRGDNKDDDQGYGDKTISYFNYGDCQISSCQAFWDLHEVKRLALNEDKGLFLLVPMNFNR